MSNLSVSSNGLPVLREIVSAITLVCCAISWRSVIKAWARCAETPSQTRPAWRARAMRAGISSADVTNTLAMLLRAAGSIASMTTRSPRSNVVRAGGSSNCSGVPTPASRRSLSRLSRAQRPHFTHGGCMRRSVLVRPQGVRTLTHTTAPSRVRTVEAAAASITPAPSTINPRRVEAAGTRACIRAAATRAHVPRRCVARVWPPVGSCLLFQRTASSRSW